jgi:hypothetical protein
MAVLQPITKKHSERGFDFNQTNLALILVVAVGVGFLVWSQPAIPEKKSAVEIATIATPPIDPRMMDLASAQGDSAVLGAVTYNKELVQKFSNIPVRTVNDNSIQAIQVYIEQLRIVESNNKLNDLMVPDFANQQLNERRAKFIDDLKEIAVPSQLVDYQRLMIAYYSVNFLDSTKDADSINQALDQIESQLQVMRLGVLSTTGIQLP